MTQNFIDITAKGNYYIVTTGWTDLETRKKNYTGQFDFPSFRTSFIGYKDLTGTDPVNSGVAITCDAPYKRVNIRSQISTTTPDGEPIMMDNEFSINAEIVNFEDFVTWLYFNTGTNIRTA